MQQNTTHRTGVSRRAVLRRGAAAAIGLALGLSAVPGSATATSRGELVEAIAADSGLSKADAKRALDAFTTATTRPLATGDRAVWLGFGSFSVSKRADRRDSDSHGGTGDAGRPENVVEFASAPELTAALDLLPGEGHTRRLTDAGQRGQSDTSGRRRGEVRIDAERLARDSNVDEKTARLFLDAFGNAVTTALMRDGGLPVGTFGAFSISKRSARTGRNPETGKEIQSAAGNEVEFKAGAELSRAVN